MWIDSWVIIVIILSLVVIVAMLKTLIVITGVLFAGMLAVLFGSQSVSATLPFILLFFFFFIWTCRVWLFEKWIGNYIEQGQHLHEMDNYDSDIYMKAFKTWSYTVADDAKKNRMVGKSIITLFQDAGQAKYNENEFVGASPDHQERLKRLQIKRMFDSRIDALKELQKKL